VISPRVDCYVGRNRRIPTTGFAMSGALRCVTFTVPVCAFLEGLSPSAGVSVGAAFLFFPTIFPSLC
jgi:hypothetical protein